MKTQKRFVISGMFKTLKFLGICLMLGALLASGTQAATLSINPGTPGEGAQNFDFGLQGADYPLLVVFTDNKTIEWNAGTHYWRSPGGWGTGYWGYFLDENLRPIPTAVFGARRIRGG